LFLQLSKSCNEVQAMLESMQLAPHPSNPQDILVTWHALKALPSMLASACQHLDQQLTHIHLNRQPMMRSLADARAELMGCLDETQGRAKADSLVAGSVRACLQAVGDEPKVKDTSEVLSRVLLFVLCGTSTMCLLVKASLTSSFYTCIHSL
jgi:hypothetical protein